MTGYCRITLAVCLLGLVTACSVANYQKPVSDFAAATENAEKALIALNQQVTEAYAETIRARALKGDWIILATSGDCNLISIRCRLKVDKPDGSNELFEPDPLLGNIVTLMRPITAYAKGLTGIVNADTTDKVATHVNATLGSVENLAKTVDKISGSSTAANVTAYKTSFGKAVNWLIGQYVAKVQLDGLRKATEAANPVMQQVVFIVENSAEFAADISKSEPQKEFEAAKKKYDDDQQAGNTNALGKNVDVLAKKATAYDRVLLAKPSSVYAKLGEAHAALTGNLHDDEISLVTVTARIESFAAEVKTLVDIIREMTAVKTN